MRYLVTILFCSLLCPSLLMARDILFGAARRGDSIEIDWLPGTGTQIRINGEIKGTVPGEDFYQAVMKIWLGRNPADTDLKDAMLGKD